MQFYRELHLAQKTKNATNGKHALEKKKTIRTIEEEIYGSGKRSAD